LEDSSRRAVELDFGMTDGQVEVTTRVGLAGYFILQMNLDRKPNEVKPERQRVVLVNRDEVDAARREAGACGPDAEDER
jgi:hypothetical protein